MTDRFSYTGLMSLPAWGLYDCADRIEASVRAKDAYVARDLFRKGRSYCATGPGPHTIRRII